MRISFFALVGALGATAVHAQQFDRDKAPSVLPPEASTRAFQVPDDLEMQLVLSEPVVAQPLQISFDERGRLWLVEYRQYPAPAGLKQVSHDKFWRSVYDKVPPPPPRHFPGKDRVSIHEDTNGDGVFDSSKVFVDGLNIATSATAGRGGVWVLNPPYLLFYPDCNGDDVPDGDPEVHLSGFGLEDTHSVANSLRWGMDGWLYGCQGSTVSGKIKVEPLSAGKAPAPDKVVATLGQNIWRYRPESRRFEVFSEGGGNAFGIEMDAVGRIFSGHNGGDTRGFHYVQGAYLQKGFQKHGELSNPFAFGYFPQMANDRVERFTHTFLIYEADALPVRYRGRLFGVEPLQGRVVLSELLPKGSTFETRDIEHVVKTSDRWFRPVDIKLGPDGAIYIADWHDFSINHWRNYQGNMDAASGRVWRLKAKGAKPVAKFDLRKKPGDELRALLDHPNRWWREAASVALVEREDPALLAALAGQVRESTGQKALGALWSWHALGGRLAASLDATEFLRHPDAQVRFWAVRFIGDPFPGPLDSGAPDTRPSSAAGSQLAALAATESSLEVRIQLAATARRLPAADAFPIIKALAMRDEDAADARQPLMIWWSLESKAATDRDDVLRLFADAVWWERPLVKRHLLERIMRRYAQAGAREDLATCAKLLDASPSKELSEILMKGFEAAFQGRSVAVLPPELLTAMARHGVGSVAIGVRRGDPRALEQALKAAADKKTSAAQRRQLIQVLGEARAKEALPMLTGLLSSENDDGILQAVFVALQSFAEPALASTAIDRLPKLAPGARAAALALLTSREEFARALLQAVESKKVAAASVPSEFVRALKSVAGESAQGSIDQLWPKAGRPTSAEMDREIARLRQALEEGHGDPYAGKRLFATACAACHRLFNQGGAIGPDLTSFDRRDAASLMLAVVNPNAEIREGYEYFTCATTDGRVLSGFIVEQDDHRITLRGIDGQNAILPRADLKSMQPAGMSLMPEGLTSGLDDQQIRDFFAYLRSGQPLND